MSTGWPAPGPELIASLSLARDASPAEVDLYVRYVRALALLSECAGHVDEPDYADLIGAVLEDAQAHYPLVVRRNGERWEIAPRVA